MEPCKHLNKEFRKVSFGTEGRYHKALQCLDCGEKLKTFDGRSCWWPHEKGEKLEEVDYELAEQRTRTRQAEEREARQFEFRTKHHEYEKYINLSQEWQERRTLVIRRVGGICEACLKNRATQVHHVNYDSLFQEICYDLRAVCKECHKKIHDIRFSHAE